MLSELFPPAVAKRSPPIVEAPSVKLLLLVKVALPVPNVLRLTTPVNEFNELSIVIAWFEPVVVKLEVPATVSVPVSAIAPAEFTFNDPVVVKSTPKSTPPVPALIVTFPSPDEAPVVKLTALPVPIAFNVKGVLKEVNPAREIVPLVLFPIIIFAAVIKPSSVLDNEKSPAP